MGDLELESDEFNRRFRVTCDDARYGTAVLHPRMMQLLSRLGPWRWRLEGPFLVSYVENPVAAQEILRRLGPMTMIVEQIPAFVWNDYGRPDPRGGTSARATS